MFNVQLYYVKEAYSRFTLFQTNELKEKFKHTRMRMSSSVYIFPVVYLYWNNVNRALEKKCFYFINVHVVNIILILM